jgi:hypothetical protein
MSTTRRTTMTTAGLKRAAFLGLVAIAAGTSTCGGVTDSRVAARDKATKAACDRYQQCMLIGPNMGQAYVTYDSCATQWRANWENAWPVATCNEINQQMLNVCLSAIAATDCANFGDFVATLFKCQAQDVCIGLPDGGDRS